MLSAEFGMTFGQVWDAFGGYGEDSAGTATTFRQRPKEPWGESGAAEPFQELRVDLRDRSPFRKLSIGPIKII